MPGSHDSIDHSAHKVAGRVSTVQKWLSQERILNDCKWTISNSEDQARIIFQDLQSFPPTTVQLLTRKRGRDEFEDGDDVVETAPRPKAPRIEIDLTEDD